MKPRDLAIGGILIVILILAFTSQGQNFTKTIGQDILPGNTTTTGNLNLCASSKPVTLTVRDGLAYTTVNAPTVTLQSGSSPHGTLESGAASSVGVYNAAAYNTGTDIVVQITGASMVRQSLPIQVPPITCGDNASTNPLSIYAILLGAYTTTVTGTDGTTFTDGSNYLISAFTGSQVTISYKLSETTANAGYKTSYDWQDGSWRYYVIELTTTGTSLGISGFTKTAVKGSSTYYFAVCPDGISGKGYGSGGGTGTYTANTGAAIVQSGSGPSGGATYYGCTGSLSYQTIGTNVYGGTASMNFIVSAGSLTAGSSQTLTITNRPYADVDKYISQNDYGPNDTTIGTVFDIIFRG